MVTYNPGKVKHSYHDCAQTTNLRKLLVYPIIKNTNEKLIERRSGPTKTWG